MRVLRRQRRVRDETGSMLIELLIAMTFLSIAVAALVGVFASTQISLRNTGIEGTALTLAESQIEVYKTMAYADMEISSVTIPGSGDVYVTANSTDATMPLSTGQVTGGTTTACTNVVDLVADCATQTTTGPDGRSYRIDTYVHEASGLKSVTVVTRQVVNGVVGHVRARASTAFDPANPPS
jgi:type II secretory pathway pseudopilin PulG